MTRMLAAYIAVMAHAVVAHIVMAYIAMAYIVMAYMLSILGCSQHTSQLWPIQL